MRLQLAAMPEAPGEKFSKYRLSFFALVFFQLIFLFYFLGDHEPKKNFQLVGAIQYVQLEESESLGSYLTFEVYLGNTVVGERVVEKPTVVLSFKTDHLNAFTMHPFADNPLWGYIPGWYFSPQLAADYLTPIIQIELLKWKHNLKPVEKPEAYLEKVGSTKPYKNTLHGMFLAGRLGLFTCHHHLSPQLEGGGKIYGLVVDSCKVICLDSLPEQAFSLFF